MQQVTSIKITSDDGKIVVYADSDVSLGSMHDFLLVLKGHIIERMAIVQNEEQTASDAAKPQEQKPEVKE